jgi:hypothetical protein
MNDDVDGNLMIEAFFEKTFEKIEKSDIKKHMFLAGGEKVSSVLKAMNDSDF